MKDINLKVTVYTDKNIIIELYCEKCLKSGASKESFFEVFPDDISLKIVNKAAREHDRKYHK